VLPLVWLYPKRQKRGKKPSGEKTTIKRKNDTVESKPDSLNVFYE
jgi:hypothetical protein